MLRQSLLPARIEGIRTASLAAPETLRLCRSERDAVLASIALSTLTYSEIGARCGVTKQAVEKWARNGVPDARLRAFCNATGTRLVEQYRALQEAMREVEGRMRERDYVAAIVRTAA